MFTEKERLAEE